MGRKNLSLFSFELIHFNLWNGIIFSVQRLSRHLKSLTFRNPTEFIQHLRFYLFNTLSQGTQYSLLFSMLHPQCPEDRQTLSPLDFAEIMWREEARVHAAKGAQSCTKEEEDTGQEQEEEEDCK